MKVLVIYDSEFGNTKKVAEAVAKGLRPREVKIVKAEAITRRETEESEVMFVGSPTQGGKPRQQLQKFLDSIPGNGWEGKRVAVFDTRIKSSDLNFFLKLLVKTIGYAAEKISKQIETKGGKLLSQPMGFIVEGKEGPLGAGEEKRAENWARETIASVASCSDK